MKRFLFTSILSFCACFAIAQSYSVQMVPNPKTRCAECYITDLAGALSLDAINAINIKLSSLEQQTTSEVAIVIVPSIDGSDASEFAYELASLWGVGKDGVDNGVLWLYVVDKRAMHIATGHGVEGVLPDAFLSNTLQTSVFPLMRQNAVDNAFIAGTNSILSRMLDESVREELLLKTDSARVTVVNYIIGYFILSLLVFLLLMWGAYYRIKGLRGDNNVKYITLKRDLAFVKLIATLFFFPNIFLYLYLKKYNNSLRTKPIDCHSCGAKMRLLSEQEEDKYLDKTKQNEERISSVDYDVWLCDACDAVSVIPYVNIETKYSKCPACNARAYSLVSKRVLAEASTFSSGSGREEYQCKNCNYVKYIPFTIPQIIIAPVVMAGRGGGFGNSGGFSGGGFGGGGFGGGGAGGSF